MELCSHAYYSTIEVLWARGLPGTEVIAVGNALGNPLAHEDTSSAHMYSVAWQDRRVALPLPSGVCRQVRTCYNREASV